MKNLKLIALGLVLNFMFSACSNKSKDIIVLNANEFVNQYENDLSGILIDVRTEDEFNNGFIEGALNFNVNDQNFKDDVNHIDKTKHIYVYCRSGKRSQKAAEILHQLGFKTIYDLKGGYIAYSNDK